MPPQPKLKKNLPCSKKKAGAFIPKPLMPGPATESKEIQSGFAMGMKAMNVTNSLWTKKTMKWTGTMNLGHTLVQMVDIVLDQPPMKETLIAKMDSMD